MIKEHVALAMAPELKLIVAARDEVMLDDDDDVASPTAPLLLLP